MKEKQMDEKIAMKRTILNDEQLHRFRKAEK
jgi:hypothetical protein